MLGDFSLALAPQWILGSPTPSDPKGRLIALFHEYPRFGNPPAGRLYRIASAADVRAVVAATPEEDPHAFDAEGAKRPHRLEAVTLDGAPGQMSWTIRTDDDAPNPAYVRRDVVVVRRGVGYRLVLDLNFDGDEHVAHAFGLETAEIVGSWRWIR